MSAAFPAARASSIGLLLALAASCRATPKTETYGAALPHGRPIEVEDVLADPERYDGRRLLLEGRVDSVCPIKGCWMLMNDGAREMRVTFEDYAFFVPKDCAGAIARVHGTFAIEMVSVADARHYLEDAGEHERAAKVVAPIESLTFVATGVELVDR